MTRCSITVVRRDGVRYDATGVTPTWRDGDLAPMLSFVCSGRMITLPAAEIARLEFFDGSDGWGTLCPTCDRALPGPAEIA